MIEKTEIGKRLRGLREHMKQRDNAGWSQSDLAAKLANYVQIDLADETGKTTVSQLERGVRTLTIELAYAYAEIFGVSLDYLYGRSNNMQSEYKETGELTGLSDRAIKQLQANKLTFTFRAALNALIESDKFPDLIATFSYYLEIKTVILVLEKYPAEDFLQDVLSKDVLGIVLKRLSLDTVERLPTISEALSRLNEQAEFASWRVSNALYKIFDKAAPTINGFA